MSAIEDLKSRMADVTALGTVSSVLGWDQQTQMPPMGASTRARQLSLMSKITHDLFVSQETEKLIVAAEQEAVDLDPDSDDAAFVRVSRRDFNKEAKLPTELVQKLAEVTAIAHEDWASARAASDYSKFVPSLEKIVDLERQVTDCLGYKNERYDALLDQYEPQMTAEEVRTVFNMIKPATVALVKAITDKGVDTVDDSVIKRNFDIDKQREFGLQVVQAIGFDLKRGRQDKAVHPFCTSFSKNDVRITTRFDPNFLPAALFGSIHETGHALYELGVGDRYDGNTLGGGASLGVHESQSRFWENLVGRSRSFWIHFYPKLQETFKGVLDDVTLEQFYRAINRVEPSLIRVEADEVTYNLHIMLRFEIEVELLEGRLSVKDAPAAWNAKCEEYLGLTPPDDAQGILQDVHWSFGGIGYFPTYTIGNIISVQLYETAEKDFSGKLPEIIAGGEFHLLKEWLGEHIHQWGRKYTPSELVKRATGRPMDAEPYLRYLKNKFDEIYKIS